MSEKLICRFGEKIIYREPKDNGKSTFGVVISAYGPEVISATSYGTFIKHWIEDASVEEVILTKETV